MAIRIMKRGDQVSHSNYIEYYIESRPEINDLPTTPEIPWGSTCFCLEDSSLHVLGSDGMWKELV